jgi:uncharacterized membrane protein
VRAYIIITGLIFALMFAVHVARVWAESTDVLTREPIVAATAVVSLGLAVWAFLLLRRPH